MNAHKYVCVCVCAKCVCVCVEMLLNPFLFFWCIWYWATNKGTHSWERLILLLPKSLVTCDSLSSDETPWNFPPSKLTCSLILPLMQSGFCSFFYWRVFHRDFSSINPPSSWCYLRHRFKILFVCVENLLDLCLHDLFISVVYPIVIFHDGYFSF